MTLTQEQRDLVASELKRFATDLSLTDDQKEKLKGFLTEASERVQEYKKKNPNASKDDLIQRITTNRTEIRERLKNFLNPEQLTKWDTEVAKAKEFLGQKLAA